MKSSEILIARRLELNPPRLTGDPAVVAEQVGLASANGFANFSVSHNGTLFYGRENPSARLRLGWRDRDGKLLEASGVRIEGMKPLFRLPASGAIPGFQPARDGRRFLVWEPEGGQQPDRPMVVVQNWAAGLAK